MPAVEGLEAVRVMASPSALDATAWPPESIAMRLAPDEVLVIGVSPPITVEDPYAIVEPEVGFVATRLSRLELERWMDKEADWALPPSAIFFAQGMVAGLPVKLWADGTRAMVVTRVSLRAELEARL